MANGTVKWFSKDKGYGFISTEDGSGDLFVHHADIEDGNDLVDGTKVTFEQTEGQKGPKAVNVKQA